MRFLPLLASAAAALIVAAPVRAQDPAADYPNNAIRIVIGFSPGGGSDVAGRAVADKLADKWGKPVIVENKTGAQGNLAMSYVAKSPADGYTLIIVPIGNAAVNPSLFKELPYDMKEFAPVSMIAEIENVLVVNSKLPAKDLKELIVLGKSKQKPFTFSSPGAGSQAHLAGELLARAIDVEIAHIPYRGLGPALNDVLTGEITLTFAQLSNAKQFIENGQLRAIGVASPKRSPALPDVPTLSEAGLPGFVAVSWYALMAPAKTPRPIIDKLSREIATIVQLPDVKKTFAALGAQPVGGTPEELQRTIDEDTVRWAKVIKEAGIPLQ
ncbi:MAG: tripartite tricarboxylate transporter substrate binding protein [Pseudorhodoplanes sp.]